jgi:hypothetical protein
LTMVEWYRRKLRKRRRKYIETSTDMPADISIIRNAKASFRTMRHIQDELRHRFPGMVDKEWWKRL